MKHTLALAVTISVLAASCGSSTPSAEDTSPPVSAAVTDPVVSEPSVTEPPATSPTVTDPSPIDVEPADDIEVFSEDGEVGIRVSGSEATTNVSVRLLDSSEWPVEVAGGDNLPGVKIYELEPDGATFEEPVVVTRRLDIAAFDSLGLGPRDVPLVTMLTQNDDGSYEMLDNLSLLRVGNSLYVSASTTHFSPIIIANENRMLPYLPGEGSDAPPLDVLVGEIEAVEAEDFSEAIQRALNAEPHVIYDESIAGVDFDLVMARSIQEQMLEDDTAVERDHIPFTPILEQGETPPEIERLFIEDPLGPPPTAGPTAEDAGYRAQRTGSYQPFVPISFAPSASAFLGTSEGAFELSVALVDLLVPETVLEDLEEEIANEVRRGTLEDGTSAQFQAEVFHRAFGVYPSSIHKRYRELRIMEGYVAFTTLWDGDPGADGRIVSFGELVLEGEDYVGESGIECFCLYAEALVLVTNEIYRRALGLDDPLAFRELISSGDGVEVFRLDDPTTGEALPLNVTGSEGLIADGTGVFASIP